MRLRSGEVPTPRRSRASAAAVGNFKDCRKGGAPYPANDNPTPERVRNESPSPFEARAITFQAIYKTCGAQALKANAVGCSQPHHAEDHAADTIAMMVAAAMPLRGFPSVVG